MFLLYYDREYALRAIRLQVYVNILKLRRENVDTVA